MPGVAQLVQSVVNVEESKLDGNTKQAPSKGRWFEPNHRH